MKDNGKVMWSPIGSFIKQGEIL
jgi:hypothetical protein